MKGRNKLVFNESTMIDALQEYLSQKMTTAPKVVAVKVSANSNSYGSATTFDVEVDGDTDE